MSDFPTLVGVEQLWLRVRRRAVRRSLFVGSGLGLSLRWAPLLMLGALFGLMVFVAGVVWLLLRWLAVADDAARWRRWQAVEGLTGIAERLLKRTDRRQVNRRDEDAE